MPIQKPPRDPIQKPPRDSEYAIRLNYEVQRRVVIPDQNLLLPITVSFSLPLRSTNIIIPWRPKCKFRIVIIGGGAIGGKIAKAIKLLGPNVELVAVWCPTIAKAEAFGKEYGVLADHDYEQMLDVRKPDLAIICTPGGAHMEPALAAIARGIHVLLEKPAEISCDRIMQMILAAEAKGVVVRCIFQKLYSKTLGAVMQALKDRRFGTPEQMQIGIMVPWYRPRSYYHNADGSRNWKGTLKLDGGAAVMNQGIHGLNQAIYAILAMHAGSPVGFQPIRSVSGAVAANITPGVPNFTHTYIEGEEHLRCQLTFANGICGSFESSTCTCSGFDQMIRISGLGGKAVVQLHEDKPNVWQFPSVQAYDSLMIGKQSGAVVGSASSAPMNIEEGPHADCIVDTLRQIEEGNSLHDLSLRNAGLAVVVVNAMYESARASGRLVNVGNFLVS